MSRQGSLADATKLESSFSESVSSILKTKQKPSGPSRNFNASRTMSVIHKTTKFDL